MILQRVTPPSPAGETLGVLLVDERPLCLTMELPWKDNQTGISCIPPGFYNWKKHISPSKGQVIWLTDTPGRTWIYFHIANFPSEVRGCIGVGLRYGKSHKGEYGVLDSAVAMSALLKALSESGTVEVRNP